MYVYTIHISHPVCCMCFVCVQHNVCLSVSGCLLAFGCDTTTSSTPVVELKHTSRITNVTLSFIYLPSSGKRTVHKQRAKQREHWSLGKTARPKDVFVCHPGRASGERATRMRHIITRSVCVCVSVFVCVSGRQHSQLRRCVCWVRTVSTFPLRRIHISHAWLYCKCSSARANLYRRRCRPNSTSVCVCGADVYGLCVGKRAHDTHSTEYALNWGRVAWDFSYGINKGELLCYVCTVCCWWWWSMYAFQLSYLYYTLTVFLLYCNWQSRCVLLTRCGGSFVF